MNVTISGPPELLAKVLRQLAKEVEDNGEGSVSIPGVNREGGELSLTVYGDTGVESVEWEAM